MIAFLQGEDMGVLFFSPRGGGETHGVASQQGEDTGWPFTWWRTWGGLSAWGMGVAFQQELETEWPFNRE